MLFEAETNAKKEALHISNKTAEEVEITKKTAMDKVDEACGHSSKKYFIV